MTKKERLSSVIEYVQTIVVASKSPLVRAELEKAQEIIHSVIKELEYRDRTKESS